MPSTDGYPLFFVGQRLTATLLQSGTERVAYKAASTSRPSTTTRTADPDLSLTVEANALYRLTGELFWSSGASSAIGWKGAFTVPSGASGAWGLSALDNTGGSTSGLSDVTGIAREISSETNAGVVASFSYSPTKFGGFVDTGATAGTLAFTWAQQTSSATGLVLEAYSFISLLRIG